MENTQEILCDHSDTFFVELHDGAIKVVCNECEVFLILTLKEENVIRGIWSRVDGLKAV